MPGQAGRPVPSRPSSRHPATRTHPCSLFALIGALGRGGDGAIQWKVRPGARSASSRVERVGGGRAGKGLDLCVCLRLERSEGAGGERRREGPDAKWLTSSTTHMVVGGLNGGEVGQGALPPEFRTHTLACRQFLRPTELVFEEIHPQTWDWFTGT